MTLNLFFHSTQAIIIVQELKVTREGLGTPGPAKLALLHQIVPPSLPPYSR